MLEHNIIFHSDWAIHFMNLLNYLISYTIIFIKRLILPWFRTLKLYVSIDSPHIGLAERNTNY